MTSLSSIIDTINDAKYSCINAASNVLSIIRTTDNWYDVFAFYLRIRQQVTVKFRKSFITLPLTHNAKYDYYCLRKFLLNKQSLPSNYTLTQENSGFRVVGPKYNLKIDPTRLPLIIDAANNLSINSINQLGEDLIEIKCEKFNLTGSFAILTALKEVTMGTFDCDFNNRIVLDIGGFQGETAVIFFTMGAKKIVIYEPLVAHHALIKNNLEKNSVIAELHAEGIGEKDCTETVHFDKVDMGFGLKNTGCNKIEISLRNIITVLSQSHASIAKIDCEGYEKCLITIPNEILSQLDYYIIETHSHKIKHAITKKFLQAGFRLNRNLPLYDDSKVTILHFAKR
jgi:methyltransferase, FkbM family